MSLSGKLVLELKVIFFKLRETSVLVFLWDASGSSTRCRAVSELTHFCCFRASDSRDSFHVLNLSSKLVGWMGNHLP